jgi:hypothetical protein
MAQPTSVAAYSEVAGPPLATPGAPTPAPPVRVAGCASATEPPVPAPRSAADLPGAPVTAVAIVGTVCSAATGEPLAGVRSRRRSGSNSAPRATSPGAVAPAR